MYVRMYVCSFLFIPSQYNLAQHSYELSKYLYSRDYKTIFIFSSKFLYLVHLIIDILVTTLTAITFLYVSPSFDSSTFCFLTFSLRFFKFHHFHILLPDYLASKMCQQLLFTRLHFTMPFTKAR